MVVVGPDGVGKTTLAAAVISRCRPTGAYFHFLPGFRVTLPAGPEVNQPQSAKNWRTGSRMLGVLRISRNFVRAWTGFLTSVRPALRRGTTVIGDRWLYGYLAQPQPLKYSGPNWLAQLVIRFAPKPDLVILLEAPPEVINQRKSELSLDRIAAEAGCWRQVVPNALRLAATEPISVLADQALAYISPCTTLKPYPPVLRHVLIPKTPKDAVFGASLYSPTRRRAVWAQRVGRSCLASLGTYWLGRDKELAVPLLPGDWVQVLKSLRSAGIDVEAVAVATRLDGREGFSLLAMSEQGPSAFVRFSSPSSLDAECQALAMVEASHPRSFRAPRVLTRGSCDMISFAAFSIVLEGFHTPPRLPPLVAVTDEIHMALESVAKPSGVPSHWAPMHGDLTPWNLRVDSGQLKLIDWEAVGWGPPNADSVLFWATSRALGLPTPEFERKGEAAAFWLGRLGDPAFRREEALANSLRDILGS